MDKKQARVDLGAVVITQNQNLLHRLEVPIGICLSVEARDIRVLDISENLMHTIKTEYTDKVWDSVRSSLFYAIYDCIEEHLEKRDYFR